MSRQRLHGMVYVRSFLFFLGLNHLKVHTNLNGNQKCKKIGDRLMASDIFDGLVR
jgi:hypothetical protein